MLSLVIAESSLERVPKEIQNHPAVTASARRFGRDASAILLDNSWHFAAMKGIQDEIKRGRPDLIHFALLAATGTPLYRENRIRIYVHTIQGMVILVGEGVRLPKSFHRFSGLVERLLDEGVVKADGRNLLEVRRMDISSLVRMIEPARVVGLSSDGSPSTYADVAHGLGDRTCLILGGFPKGRFSEDTRRLVDELYSVDRMPLELHTVLGRIIYEYEKTIFM